MRATQARAIFVSVQQISSQLYGLLLLVTAYSTATPATSPKFAYEDLQPPVTYKMLIARHISSYFTIPSGRHTLSLDEWRGVLS